MTKPKPRPFGPDAVAAVSLAVQWILLPMVLFGVALIDPTPNREDLGRSKDGFLVFLVPIGVLFLILFGWICLRVRGGQKVGFVAAAIVQGLSLASTALSVIERQAMTPGTVVLGTVVPVAALVFVAARLGGWGPKPI